MFIVFTKCSSLGEWGNKCIMTGIDDTDQMVPVNLKSVTLGICPNPSGFSGLNVSIKTPNGLNKVLLEIVNMQGFVIEQIPIEFMEKGEHLYSFSSHSDLPAGIYLFRFKSIEGMNCIEKAVKIN